MGMHSGGWRAFIRHDEQQDQPEVNVQLLRRVAGYAKPYVKGVLLILITIIGISMLTLLPPLLVRDLIDHAIPEADAQRLNFLALGMIAVPLVNGLLGVGQRYVSAVIGEGIIFDLRCALYDHLQRMSLRFFTNTQVGELISRLNNDVIGAQRAITGTLVTVISNFIALIATLAIMLSLEWRLTLLGVLVLPVFVLPARRVGRLLRRIAREQMDANAWMNAQMTETLNISGVLLVKLFGRHRSEVQKFSGRARKVRDLGVRQSVIGRWFFLALSLASAIGSALIFWAGGHLVLRGAFSIGTIVAFSVYIGQLYGPLMAMTNARVELATSLVSFERVFEVLDMPHEISDRPAALALKEVRGHVRYQEVSFRYEGDSDRPEGLEEIRRFSFQSRMMPPSATKKNSAASAAAARDPWVLKGVDFEIKPGEVAALVGPSGAGKTTITYLLPRLYDTSEGRIMLDEHDLRDIELESLAQHIGMVTQEIYLFHDTIRNNLLFASPEASEEQLIAACQAANIYAFIQTLPEGFDTMVGERGYRLSGGEKQRVAIARVILKDPKVLILDEATSHLDSHSEALIQQAMEVVMRGRTSLVIAHRLSTIMDADHIMVIDQGRVVEEGQHEVLLAQGGLYADLYHTQFSQSEANHSA